MRERISPAFVLGLALLVLPSALLAQVADKPVKHTEIRGAVNHIALKYLPDDRYSGDMTSPRGDYELLLSLHLPKEGKGPFPVVFYVHGGAWSGGTKEGGERFAQDLNKRGIAYCGFNYMLLPKGVWPQVYWDFRNAARYLRKNADKYNIDPLRFGAYGISAGGWLISIAMMPDGDYWQTGHSRAMTTAEILAKGGRIQLKKDEDRLGPYGLYKPIHDPTPAWPGEAGGFSALAWDFAYCVEYGDASSPAVQQWVGPGATAAGAERTTAGGARITLTELISQKYKNGVHVPAFYARPGNDEGIARTLDGKATKDLAEVTADFFVRELMSPAARPPAPEIYPIPRLIAGPTPVTMVAARGATIHYTTDGTAPTIASPAYKGPVTVTPGTTVKAITAAPGMAASGVHSAEFLAGTPPPSITGPDSLPPGETGRPYTLTFTASTPKARWQINGDLVPNTPWKATEPVYPNGMHFDADTGIWSGTPTQPGKFWVQVWVAEAPGMMAGYRNYSWTVTGKAIEPAKPQGAATQDQNVSLASLTKWPAADASALMDLLKKQGVRAVSPNEPGDAAFSVVVHKADLAKARDVLRDYTRDKKTLADGTTLSPPGVN